MKFIIDDEVVLSRPLEGPLAAHITAFAKWVKRPRIRAVFPVPTSFACGAF
jgi:hypothetical protein